MKSFAGEAALAILPYCSNIDVVRHPEIASQDWAAAVDSEDIRLSAYSELVVDVGSRMCAEQGVYTCIITPGEHTFGSHNRSTSELMQQRLAASAGVQQGHVRIVPDMPTGANNTYDQLQWLKAVHHKHRLGSMAILCMKQHLPRTQYIARALSMDCQVVAVEDQFLTQDEQKIVQSFTTGNYSYEQRVYTCMRIIRRLAGQYAMGAALRYATQWRTPNVIDVQWRQGRPEYYCLSAKKRVGELMENRRGARVL